MRNQFIVSANCKLKFEVEFISSLSFLFRLLWKSNGIFLVFRIQFKLYTLEARRMHLSPLVDPLDFNWSLERVGTRLNGRALVNSLNAEWPYTRATTTAVNVAGCWIMRSEKTRSLSHPRLPYMSIACLQRARHTPRAYIKVCRKRGCIKKGYKKLR